MKNIEMTLGPPGCGKTTYLVNNILLEVLKVYNPMEVAFVSFTRKGTYEGVDRAKKEFNIEEKQLPYFRTIHSLAFRDLGVSRYDMISRYNYKQFSEVMGMKFLGYYTQDLVNNDDKYLFWTSLSKNNPKLAEKLLEDLDFKKALMVRNNYERYKKEMKIKDFDDLIVEFIKNNKPLPVKIAIIDEAQDLTFLQWEFCKVAFRNCDTVYIAGDDDQAIYEWSGADIKFFLNLATKSKVKILDKSYRLKRNILNESKKISNLIKDRIDKTFDPFEDGGNIFYYNSVSEVPINKERKYYLLARNNYHLTEYKQMLMKAGRVFTIKDKNSVDRAKHNAIKLYENYRKNNPQKIKSEMKITSFLRKDFKWSMVLPEWYKVFELTEEEDWYYRELFKQKVDVSKSNLHVSTIHGVKGGEADDVIIRLDYTRNVEKNINLNQGNFDSEMRCLYVALTRAKNNLHIVLSTSTYGYDKTLQESIYDKSL